MSDSVVVRLAERSDAAAIAATIAAAFEQYRGKLKPESGAFLETAKGIGQELRRGLDGLLQRSAPVPGPSPSRRPDGFGHAGAGR